MKLLSVTAGASPAALLFDSDKITFGSLFATDKALKQWVDRTNCTNIIESSSTYFKAKHVSEIDSWVHAARYNNNIDHAAVLLSLPSGVYMGSYFNNNIQITKQITYSNSLELFLYAGMRFVSANSIDDLLLLAKQGKPTYTDIITNYIIRQYSYSNYELLIDLTRGIGRGPRHADIACSILQVYDSMVSGLAYYITDLLSTNNLIVSGWILKNPQLLTRLKENYSLFIPPSSDSSILALGALVKQTNIQGISLDFGQEHEEKDADSIALAILANKTTAIKQKHGKQVFTTANLGRNASLIIPFEAATTKISNLPIYVCQNQDYNQLFKGYSKDYYAQFLHKPILPGLKEGRVLVTDLSRNFYLNRILTITRSNGYPVLQIIENEI